MTIQSISTPHFDPTAKARRVISLVGLMILILAMSACSTDLVYNRDSVGPIFVTPKPAPQPLPAVPTVNEINDMAVVAFTELGFESQVNDKGVVVYLPPEIYFKGTSSTIDPYARIKIALIADELQKQYLQDRNIEVSGHTDSTGDNMLNLRLSKDRANAAAGELVFSNVDPDRVFTTFFGEMRPRYSEQDSEGRINELNRARNRRVEFIVLNPN